MDRNDVVILTSLNCKCKPRIDVFTYRGWQEQRYQVMKGEKGIKLNGRVAVFCRCQVEIAKEKIAR